MKVKVAQSCPTICNPMDCSAPQAPLSMEFSRQEYWSGLPFLSPGDLPDPRMEPRSPALQADSLVSGSERIFHTCSTSQFGWAAIQVLNSHMWLLATMLNSVVLEININNWLIVLGRISQRGWKSEIILKEVRARLDNSYEEHFFMWENYNYLLSNEST